MKPIIPYACFGAQTKCAKLSCVLRSSGCFACFSVGASPAAPFQTSRLRAWQVACCKIHGSRFGRRLGNMLTSLNMIVTTMAATKLLVFAESHCNTPYKQVCLPGMAARRPQGQMRFIKVARSMHPEGSRLTLVVRLTYPYYGYVPLLPYPRSTTPNSSADCDTPMPDMSWAGLMLGNLQQTESQTFLYNWMGWFAMSVR